MATSKWAALNTEAVNPATCTIDKLGVDELVELIIADNRRAVEAAEHAAGAIARGVELVNASVRRGGRIIFVGAGTSGRLGVLEAAEMPPTFGVPLRTVRAVMAGGAGAVHQAREGVEDDSKAGDRAIGRFGPTNKDVVVGISASGVTPFVQGALLGASRAGARIIVMTCSASSSLNQLADVSISLDAGPEVIAGSTRLKAGTATKIALNALTTAAMVRAGKTYGNLMVDVQATSAKLRDRSRRILCAVTHLDPAAADKLLRRAKGNVKVAIVMQMRGLDHASAVEKLRAADGAIRGALDER